MVNSACALHPPARRNRLALVSVFLSLVFPIGVICELLGSGFIAQTLVASTPLWSPVGAALVLIGLPATALAIVAGHVALRRADRHPFQQPLRGVARIGLLLAAAEAGEISSDIDAYELLRGIGNLCIGADNDPHYNARRMVELLIAGLLQSRSTCYC